MNNSYMGSHSLAWRAAPPTSYQCKGQTTLEFTGNIYGAVERFYEKIEFC